MLLKKKKIKATISVQINGLIQKKVKTKSTQN